MRPAFVLGIFFAIALTGCEREDAPPPSAGAAAPAATSPAAPSPAVTSAAVDRRPRVIFLGDSLTAGLGVNADQAFPALVGQALEKEGLDVRIINAGVSGDTTAGGLRRLDWLLRQSPDVIVIGLGGNDGLRGTSLAASEENLRQIIAKSRAAGTDVLLLGMLIPPNYGPEYAGGFKAIYPRLAREMNVPLVPFLLEGVGGDPRLNQRDGIHPTAEGHQIIARTVTPRVLGLLKQRLERPAPSRAGE